MNTLFFSGKILFSDEADLQAKIYDMYKKMKLQVPVRGVFKDRDLVMNVMQTPSTRSKRFKINPKILMQAKEEVERMMRIKAIHAIRVIRTKSKLILFGLSNPYDRLVTVKKNRGGEVIDERVHKSSRKSKRLYIELIETLKEIPGVKRVKYGKEKVATGVATVITLFFE